MKKLFIGIALLTLISCHSKYVKTYDVTLIVTGQGTYHYQIGATEEEGVVSNQKTFTGTVKAGDLVELDAIADVPGNDMTVELESTPLLGTANQTRTGLGIVQVMYQVK